MAMLQPEWLRGLRDLPQVRAPHRDIDVFGQSAGIRFHLLDVKVGCQAAGDSIFESGGSKDSLHQFRQIKKTFHAFLEKRKPDFNQFRMRNKKLVEEYLAGVAADENQARKK